MHSPSKGTGDLDYHGESDWYVDPIHKILYFYICRLYYEVEGNDYVMFPR